MSSTLAGGAGDAAGQLPLEQRERVERRQRLQRGQVAARCRQPWRERGRLAARGRPRQRVALAADHLHERI